MTLLLQPAIEFFAELSVQVGAPHDVGQTAHGRRRLIPIVGGHVTGVDWRARVLPGGCDVQLVGADGATQLDARYVLEADGGDLIYVRNRALRNGPPAVMQRLLEGEAVDSALVYFRCCPTFETASASLGWIQERIFVGTGTRLPHSVEMCFFQVQ